MSAEENQQVEKNFLIRQCVRFCNLIYTQFVSILFEDMDETDHGNCSSIFRHYFQRLRNALLKHSRIQNKRVIYPKLELPSVDLHFEYKMNHKHRGMAVIFNHEEFYNNFKSKRKGTDKDKDRLIDVLQDLQFEIKSFDDLPFAEMKRELKKISLMDHTDNDCLVVTILTHGDFRSLSSYDADYTIRQVTSYFSDENCPSLKGKPRLFFIQACRGNKFDGSYKLQIHKDRVYNLHRNPIEYSDGIDTNPFQNVEDEIIYETEEEDFVHNPPNHKDFLVVRSTMPKYFSFRNTTEGSWFIQDLCDELEVNGTTHNILDLLTHVNMKVSERESNAKNMLGCKQILCISSMLTKILIFTRKSENLG